jgi:hypothetical protein
MLTEAAVEATFSSADIRGLASLTDEGLECSEVSILELDFLFPVILHLSYLPFART